MKIRFAAVLLLSSAFAFSAHAQAAAPPARIAVIAFQTAVSQTNEAQRDLADLEKKYEPKRQQLKALNDEIETMQKQLKSDQDKLSKADVAKRAKAIADKQKQLKREFEDTQKAFQGAIQQMLSSLSAKVYDVLVDYAKKQGYTSVMDSTMQQQSAPTIIFFAQSSDITKAIVDAYNVKSGIPAAPAAAHTAPKAPAK